MKSTELKIFSGNANKALAKEVCDVIGVKPAESEVTKFKDGEIGVKICESVRNADVFIIQPTCNPTNDNLMELILLIDAAHRASAAGNDARRIGCGAGMDALARTQDRP